MGERRRPVRLPAATLLVLGAAAGAGAQQTAFDDVLEVHRLQIDVRVVSPAGEPLRSLTVDDFEVRIGGRPVVVEAVDRLGPGAASTEASGDVTARGPADEEAGDAARRVVVLFFQRDLDPSRGKGLLRMAHEARRLVRSLDDGDLVAVISFDSRLRLHTDLTADRRRALAALDDVVLAPHRAGARADGGLALAPMLARRRAAGDSTVDDALARVALALEPVPHAKSLVFVGWGLGELVAGAVRGGPGFATARDALRRGRTAFLALDVTTADHHSLDALLQGLALDTGGLYRRTHVFPSGAMDTVRAAVAGHYRLTVVAPEPGPGRRRLAVRLRAGGAMVSHPAEVD